MQITELWKDIELPKQNGFYQISNFGRVKSLARLDNRGFLRKEKILKSYPNMHGYLVITFNCNKVKSYHKIHSLVVNAFFGRHNQTVNHIDGNKLNNNLSNLEIIDSVDNVKLAWKMGLTKPAQGEAQGNSKLKNQDIILIREMAKNGATNKYLSEKFGVSRSQIFNIKTFKYWKHVQ